MRLSRSLGTAENQEFAENWCENKIGIPPLFQAIPCQSFVRAATSDRSHECSHHKNNSLKAIDLVEDVRSQTDVHGLGILDHLLWAA